MKLGFTLIEMSIVLVIIGLIVGGILVGRDLINGAAIRSQISQIEKYQSAVHTFRNKYGGLPGDLQALAASQFGLTARTGTIGDGDGNGELDGNNGNGTGYAWNQQGENLYFWEDLSSTGLIEGTFNSYLDGVDTYCVSPACSVYFPYAKIGGGNFIYVYSGYANNCPGGGTCISTTGIGANFFGLSIINSINENVNNGPVPPAPGLTAAQSYAIDKKIDDGFPTTGKVVAQYLTNVSGHPGWSTNGSTPTASTCYDTSSGGAAYSTNSTGINNLNCGLSFQFGE